MTNDVTEKFRGCPTKTGKRATDGTESLRGVRLKQEKEQLVGWQVFMVSDQNRKKSN